MPSKPFENSRLAQFVTTRVLELRGRKTQAEIAAQAGFTNPNVMSMLKSGANKLPLDRVPSLAKALECDPAYLLLLALEQAEGNTTAVALMEIMGTPVTSNELGWLREIRDASENTDPRLTGRGRTALRAIFGK